MRRVFKKEFSQKVFKKGLKEFKMSEVAEFVKEPYNELLKESVRLGVGVERLDFHLLGFKSEYSTDAPPPENADKAGENAPKNGENSANKNAQTPKNAPNSANSAPQNAQSPENAPPKPEFKPNFKALSEKELTLFDDESVFLNENLKIRQSYKIQIYQTNTLKKIHKSPKIKLVENKDLSKLIADMDFTGVVYYQNIAMEILQDIYKKMIKDGFFVGIRIFDFKKELIEVITQLKNKTLKHPKIKLEVATGVHPISPESEKLIICYKDKIPQVEGIQKVSLVGIGEGELILRHIVPGTARRGRNLKLEFIEPHLPPENKIEFSCSENFEAKELCKLPERVHCVEYYAKKKGFVTQTPDGKFEIENELNLTSATFKETGAILGGLDKGITVNIKSASDLEDAVGSGVHIECETLVVNGNVGSNTILKAKSVKIYGNTNNSAKIYADDAYISTHKGYLKAEKADIDTLENGVIEAKAAKIKKGMGGKISVQRALLSSLGSNNSIDFSQLAIIEQCSGNNNKFTAQLFGENEALSKLKAIEARQRELPKLIEQLESAINSSKGGVEMLMKKINEFKKQNFPAPPNFIRMVNEYRGYVSELGKLNAQESELKIQKEELIRNLKTKEEELFEAKIINKGKTWEDMNVIKWRFGTSECTFMPKRGDEAPLIYAKYIFDSKKVGIEVGQEIDERDLEWLKG